MIERSTRGQADVTEPGDAALSQRRLELRLLLERALDDDVRRDLAEAHVPEEEARRALLNDRRLLESLIRERITFLRDPTMRVELTHSPRAEFGRPSPREWFRILVTVTTVVGYHQFLFAAWRSMPALLGLVGVLGALAATVLAARRLYHTVAPVTRLIENLVLATPEVRLWRQYALAEIVRPELRQFLEKQKEPRYSTELAIRGVRNLYADAEDTAPIATSAGDQLRRAVTRSTTGAIALAGHRGVGKTTAIRNVAAGLLGDPGRPPPLSVIASAPARYDARDFVLHLHALLCKEVLVRTRVTPGGRRAAVGTTPPLRPAVAARWRGRLRGVLRSLLGYLLAVGMLVLGAVLAWDLPPTAFSTPISTVGGILADFPDHSVWQIAVLCLAALVALSAVLDLASVLWRALRAALRRLRTRRRSPLDPGIQGLRMFAEHQLRRIRFLQTYTAGWSGKVAFPLRSEAGANRSTQSAEQQLTYPEVVEEFRVFARHTAEVLRAADVAERVVIAIDEIDKIVDPDTAQELINDVKGIFDVPGCLFLVSLSDDAVVAFERRGLPARDAFDSAFSAMVRLDGFSVDESRSWLRQRLIQLPEQFVYLCHCLSGGLPRDLRRCTIDMLDVADGLEASTLEPVTRGMIQRELDRKTHAFIGTARSLDSSPARSNLLADLLTVPDLADDELAVLADKLREAAAGDEEPELSALRRQVACYLLFCATLRAVFRDTLTRDRLHGVHSGEPEVLATARQQMALDPEVCWELLTRFRRARDLGSAVGPGR